MQTIEGLQVRVGYEQNWGENFRMKIYFIYFLNFIMILPWYVVTFRQNWDKSRNVTIYVLINQKNYPQI